MTPTNILSAADKARAELREQLGSGNAGIALAVALGRVSAETGIPLSELVAMAEVARDDAKRSKSAA
jgi:hypothetical protein